MFSFGLGSLSRSKKKAKSEVARKRSTSYARDRSRKEDSDASDPSSGSESENKDKEKDAKRRVHRTSSRRERDRANDDKNPRSRSRPRRNRTASDKYQSSSSSTRSRRKSQGREPMTESRRASEARAGMSESKSRSPYPSFSKAHSREAPTSRESLARKFPNTPEHTDISERPFPRRPVEAKRNSWNKSNAAPPSPPLTNEGSHLRASKSTSSVRKDFDSLLGRGSSQDLKAAKDIPDTKKTTGPPSPTKHLRFSASRNSLRAAEEGTSSNATSPWSSRSKQAPDASSQSSAPPLTNPVKSPNTSPTRNPRLSALRPSNQPSIVSGSDATTATATYKRTGTPPTTLLSARTASKSNPPPPPPPPPPFGKSSQGSRSGNHTPIVEVVTDDQSVVDVSPATPVDHFFSASAPPPPPPAPSDGPQDIPRVDYLLQNGGISKLVTKHFSMAQKPPDVQIYQQYPPPQPVPSYVSTFSHYDKLLENYQNVIQKNGSLAVATGYKSVARRLLDRLEDVFSRNISSELCSCVMCREERDSSRSFQRDTSVSWGEVLELVSGRRELPPWPPFVPPTSSTANTNLDGIVRPMQKLDIDISEEWRDHFIRQSKKTKQTVDKWLACQPEEQAAPPTEVDDDTLSFTMATYLDTEKDRRTFFALVRGSQDIRAPTPAPTDPKPDLMPRTATALQRLYYLPTRPRDPECAMFLLNNPSHHTALATLAAISAQEWDLLISGRFDGLLVSGAESQFPSFGAIPSRGPTPHLRGPSRGPTPFRSIPSRGPTTPGPNGTHSPSTPGPVQMDEETEIAVLGEIEREILLGVEQLDDALEALHERAMGVCAAIRSRSAGLSLSARQRGGDTEELRAVMGTPFTGFGGDAEADSPQWGMSAPGTPFRPMSTNGFGLGHGIGHAGFEDDDGMDDAMSLAPDDSASNIGFSSRRRKHRRREGGKTRPRRTPAPVEEEDESEA